VTRWTVYALGLAVLAGVWAASLIGFQAAGLTGLAIAALGLLIAHTAR